MKEERARTIYRKNYTPPNYRVTEIGLEFKLFENETIVQSKLKIESLEKDLVKPNPLVLDGEQLELLEIKLDGTTLQSQQYQIETSSLTIPSVPETFDLEIKVRIHPEKNTSLEGLYRSGTMFCTQCEAEGFRRITYFPDRPDVMARYKTRIEADSELYPVLLSNGNLLQTEDLEDGRHAAVWEDPFPKPSYLFAMVAGNLECLEDCFTTQSGREVLLKIYVEPGNLERTHHAMRSLKESMEWDEKRFGREYDLDLFMIVAVDDFNAGAMENKGLNIFNSRLVLASPETATDRDYNLVQGVIAHEYFHNWTGNRVTCRDWFQLSLKEGLTVFRDQEFSADMNSRAVQRISDVNLLRSHQFPEDAGPMSHPVRPDSYQEINNFYTLTVYEKGAEVIRMMHTLLGEDGFRKGMDLYFERHDGQAVTCEDFVSALEDANDFNLKQFRRWYSQSGTPKLEIEGNYNQELKTFTLKVKQSCPDTPGQNGFGQRHKPETKSAFQKEAFLLPLKIGLLDEDGNPLPLKMEGKSIKEKQQTLVLSEMEQEFVFEDLTKKPIPSLLRHFSAPVDLFYGYSDEELALISSKDSDEFNRWEAGQQLMLRSFLSKLKNYKDNKAIMLPETLLQSFRNQLDHSATGDPSLMAQALSFPSESYLGEKMEVIDVEAVISIRKKFLEELALELEEDWKRVYKNMLDEGPYNLDPVSMGRRKLKNLCLEFIVRSNQIRGAETAFLQYQNSSNMTDTMGALSALNDSDSEERKKAMTKFEQKWFDEPLVLDKWFSLQATSKLLETLEKVKSLTRHSKFDRNNPNRIRSVIGAFSMGNFSGFHEISGNGYRFLADSVIEYDRSNPMVAARLAGGFNRWRKFDSQRQELMQTEMERIAGVEELSSDVREIISKSLQSPELATSQGES
ncbi:MAG: aminopeptidase N [SAR324 cluster bacterium]|nr:aminopeptidase N [SAR324 cluster bacterium]